jgi:hypothetical protein
MRGPRPLRSAVLGRRGHRTLVVERDGVAGSPLERGALRGARSIAGRSSLQTARRGGCAQPAIPDGLVKITVVRQNWVISGRVRATAGPSQQSAGPGYCPSAR